jgi:hypothetical protein
MAAAIARLDDDCLRIAAIGETAAETRVYADADKTPPGRNTRRDSRGTATYSGMSGAPSRQQRRAVRHCVREGALHDDGNGGGLWGIAYAKPALSGQRRRAVRDGALHHHGNGCGP